jgi:hypothetical protein
MSAVTGSRPLQRGGHAVAAADVQKRDRIKGPRAAIEVAGEKPARVVLEQRIHPDGLRPYKVFLDDLVGQG